MTKEAEAKAAEEECATAKATADAALDELQAQESAFKGKVRTVVFTLPWHPLSAASVQLWLFFFLLLQRSFAPQAGYTPQHSQHPCRMLACYLAT